MLEKLYELWSIEKRVSVTIKSVGLNCTFTTVIENIYKGEDSVVLEFGDNNMKLDVTENCTCNIQFWDKEDSTKLDAKKLMDMIK